MFKLLKLNSILNLQQKYQVKVNNNAYLIGKLKI